MLDLDLLKEAITTPHAIYLLLKAWQEMYEADPTLPRMPDAYGSLRANWHQSLLRELPVTEIPSRSRMLAWWSRYAEELSDRLQGCALHVLLRHLDLCYSQDRVSTHRYGDDWLVLGRRWWNARETRLLHADGTPRRPLADYVSTVEELRFPHLRCVRAPSLAVASGEQFARFRFSLGITNSMRIGLASMSGHAKTHFRASQMVEQGHMGYIATGIRCTNKEEKAEVCSDYLNELKAVVAQARKERVDVLCLPELCVCKQGCLAMEEAMSEAAARLESDMMLVVAGSFHNPVAESEPVQVWKNEAPVWVVRSGKVEEVVRIAKTQPFVINDIASISEDPTLSELYKKATERECDKLVEDITPATTTTLIRTPVGLWGFLICLDALYEQETLQALRILADHVVIISMDEKGPADFRSFAMKQHKFHLSGVYYVNAAQRLNVADKPRDELHAAFWPPSRDLNEAERTAKEFVTDAAASANARSQKPPAEVCPRSENGFYVVRFPLGGIVH